MLKFEFNDFVIEEVMETGAPANPVVTVTIEKKPEQFHVSSVGVTLQVCPKCSQKTLKVESGCHSCMNTDCGYGKCE